MVRPEDYITGNRRGVGRLEGYIVDVTEQRALELTFTGINCMVRVEGTLSERTRDEDSLYIGNPEPDSGIGRGGIGTTYGDWSPLSEESEAGTFTVDGRQTVVDSLRGIENGIFGLAVGKGSSPEGLSDTELDDEVLRRGAWLTDTGTNEVTALRPFPSLFVEEITEAGLIDREGRLMCRLLFGETTPESAVSDYRVEITLTFESQTLGDGVLTDLGLEAITDSVSRSQEVVGIDRMLIGTGDADPTSGDTSLDQPLDSKTVERNARSDSVAALTSWFEDEPAGHPHTLQEVGLEDNAGRLLWRTVFEPEEKTDDLPIIVGSTLRII